ncbi:ataxin-3-like isoform X1 [Hyalella azteca]|uniref:Ataxin-3 homolog n=1 Tax=Hyalella azteca TaxID=294128 RepID=A0A8B7NV41_HYAAZ|nr:ataxin-3-like isoform X1 [Hyalella azteca]
MMEIIRLSEQEGSLCAVHCLNALLQGCYFSAVDLATIARQMDCLEQQRMAEMGTNTAEYQSFFKEGSNNMDDSGMFSIQVVSVALEVWGLTLTPFTSTVAPTARLAREDPTSGCAYICNMKEHWFTIRKIGNQWFNLNSLLAFPELLSNTYVSLFLAQLQKQGYCIYIVEGSLPQCEADTILKTMNVTQKIKPPLLSELQECSQTRQELDDDLAAAMAASLAQAEDASTAPPEGEHSELENALQLSLTEHLTRVPNHRTPLEGDLEKALRLSLAGSGGAEGAEPGGDAGSPDEETRQLQAALELSLLQPSTSALNNDQGSSDQQETLDATALREKRLAYFKNKPSPDES